MSTSERLYQLLPAIYRLRDAEQREPLRALLSVIAEQVAVLEEDLAQLYDDQFIETCAEWVVPYIGDLVGYRTIHGVSPEVSNRRAEVANTIAYRRRKGTAAVIEQLARDVTGWDARAVEFFQRVATTQHLNHLRPGNLQTPDLRRWEPLARLGTPFDELSRSIDVRRISSRRGQYNLPNIGIFLWRLRSFPLSASPAFRVDDRRYRFSPLGNDSPLFSRPETEAEITHLAEPVNVPMPIGRRHLHENPERFYGAGKSFVVEVDDRMLSAADLVVCDLSDVAPDRWAHTPPDARYGVDPVLGRIALPDDVDPPARVTVSFHYGFSAEMGGGEYERVPAPVAPEQPVRRVAAPASIQDALDAVADGGAVEIADSGRYAEALSLAAGEAALVVVRAANHHRPSLILGGEPVVTGGRDAEVVLDGLLLAGATLRVPASPDNRLRRLRLQHCTLVPGSSLTMAGEPEHPTRASLVVEAANVVVEIDRCIVGALRIVGGAEVRISRSIVDATAESLPAYSAPEGSADPAGGVLRVENSTLIGTVHTAALEYASNSIFLAQAAGGVAPVRSERTQSGCVRFSYLPPGSRTPQRYRCQPEGEGGAAWVRPHFTSLRYGEPGYGQLSRRSPLEIRQGADDEAEMGAFHDLYQPQRETNLRVRLDEYLRFGLEAGIFYVS